MSLQVWLPLDGSLENKGLSDLKFSVVNTTNTTIADSGKVTAQCYSNNSRTSGGIISNNQLNINKTISIFAWIKYTSRHSNPMGIGGMHTISGASYPAGTGMGIQIIQKPTNTSQNVLAVSTGDGSGRTWNVYYSNTPLSANVWYHVGFTYDGTNIKFYINGVWDEKVITYTKQKNIADYVHLFAWSQNGNATKPNTYSSDYKFNGCINDFRIYDHCLTKKEVKEIAKGLRLSYGAKEVPNLFNIAEYVTNTCSNSTIVRYNDNGFKLTSTGHDPYVGTALAGGGSIGSYITFPVVAGKTYRISWTHISGPELNKNFLTYINSNNTAVKTYTSYGGLVIKKGRHREYLFTPPTYTVKVHLRFGNQDELTSGLSTIVDEVSLVAYDSAIQKPVFYFNGTNDYIDLGATTLDMSNITFIARARWDALQAWSRIWDFGVASGGAKEDFLLANNSTSNSMTVAGRLAAISGESAAPNLPDTNVGTIEIGKWYHIAVVVNGLDVTTYISNDNQFKTQYNTFELKRQFNTTNIVDFKNCYLGKSNWSADAYFKGAITDFQIYSSALTEDDIKSLYLTAQSIDRDGNEFIYELDEEDSNSKVTRQGEHNCNYLSEILQKTESDGSISYWIQVLHHNNRANTVRFDRSSASNNKPAAAGDNSEDQSDFCKQFVYKSSDCWSAFPLIKSWNEADWEFMYIENQKTTDDIIVRQWSQNIDPFIATYNDVKPGSSRITTKLNMPDKRGMYKYHNTNSNEYTYFCIANNSTGNWFGAIGAFYENGHDGGMPNMTSFTTGVVDLYVRINPEALKYREFRNGIVMPTTINEI